MNSHLATSNSVLITIKRFGVPQPASRRARGPFTTSKALGLPPMPALPIMTRLFLQHSTQVRSGGQARLLGAHWVSGLGGRERLVPFYRWQRLGSVRTNFPAEIKQAAFSLTPELDLKHPSLPQDRLDIFPGKSSLISQVSALTALTSDQIGSTRAARLETSIQFYVLLGTAPSALFPLPARCDSA